MENSELEEVKSAIKEARDALKATTTTANERELILKQLNLLQEKENLLLTHLCAQPTTCKYEFLLIKKNFIPQVWCETPKGGCSKL